MKIKLDAGAFAPVRQHPRDAGLDIMIPDIPVYKQVIVPSYGNVFIDTGIHIELPAGYAGVIKSRSGLFKNHCVFTNGLIDENYRGPIGVTLMNNSPYPLELNPGDRIAQLLIVPCIYPDIEVVDKLSGTDRGENGFGSTGL